MRLSAAVRLALVALLCTLTFGLAPAATAASAEPCFDTGSSQDFDPGCTVDDPGFDTSSPGIPSGFVAFFVLAVILGIGGTIWRVSTARSLATDAGLDPDVAGRVALMDEGGLSATYVASSLRNQRPVTAPSPPTASTSDRLAELKGLLDRGLITQVEHDERRKAIIDSV